MTSHSTRKRGGVLPSFAACAALILTASSVFAGSAPKDLPRPQTTPLPDLVCSATRLTSSLRISSRTFGSSSCSVVEGCVVPGARRILEFDTQIQNLGTADAILGVPANNPNLYVFSPCHGHYHMLDSLDYSMTYGGTDTVALFDNTSGSYFLKNTNLGGNADVTFTFGAPGLTPISGDWNADGTSTIGAYDPTNGTFFLRNSNTPGNADVTFTFGAGGQGFVPVTGDWDGDGDDTVGLYQPSTGVFFLRNTNANGNADVTFGYGPGNAGFTPVAGDWDGNDFDTVGLYSPATGTFFLRNSNSPGSADMTFSFGPGGAFTTAVGDWDANGVDTIGVYDPTNGMYFTRNSNSAGVADNAFQYGVGGGNIKSLCGDWDYDQKGVTLPGIVGLKQAFCWLDSQRVQGSLPAHYNCSNQGITAGWSDVYGRGLDCQWIDITGLAAGNYQMRVSVNDSHTIVTESNYDNNVAVIKVHITPSTGPQPKAPEVTVTSQRSAIDWKVGQPVTITWDVAPGANVSSQEIWYMPSPKGVTPNQDPFHADPHHDAIARSKIIVENLPANARSFTWTPSEDFMLEAGLGAQIMVRVQDKANMVGTDQRSDGVVTIVK